MFSPDLFFDCFSLTNNIVIKRIRTIFPLHIYVSMHILTTKRSPFIVIELTKEYLYKFVTVVTFEYFLLKCLNYFFCLIISNIFSFASLFFFETHWPVEKLYYTCRTEIMKYRRRIKICLLPSSGFPNEF